MRAGLNATPRAAIGHMNVFELVKRVLDEAFDDIDAPTEKAKVQKIVAAREGLRERYANLGSGGPSPSYRDPATRFAYVFGYVTSHANLVADSIMASKDLRALFDSSEKDGAINVACLGGGPGSDFLGILKHMIRWDADRDLRCHLLDKEGAWGDSWSDVDGMVNGVPFRVSTHFQSLDVGEEETWEHQRKYLKADLFTLIYFASELWAVRQQSEAFFKHVFSRAKQGALVLYIDNDADVFSDWFDRITSEVGLQVIKSGTDDARMPSDEQKDALGRYFELLGWPKMKARVATRVLRVA